MRNTNIRFDATPRQDEIHDLSPASFRFILAILLGLAVLAIAGVL